LVEMIVEKAGLIAAYEAERTDEALGRAENIREFFTVVSEFASAHETPDLPAFMEWLALRTDLDSIDEAADEFVTLMTVHTAKGLEYPVVFVAGLEEGLFPHTNALMADDIQEERRLMYVAITRARERLYLTSARVRTIFGRTDAATPSKFLREIPSECVQASGVGSAGFSGSGWEKRGQRGGSYGHGAGDSGGRVFGSGARQGGVGFEAKPAGPKAKEVTESFSVGDAVDHKVFGRGTVISVNGDALEIMFDRTRETKKLLVGYAPIVKIKG
jgi:DNA helicase-2/ATP-dependent DNA helicase PcrA